MATRSFLTDPIFFDRTIEIHFSDQALIEAMVRVEEALADAQETLGIVPTGAAKAISEAIRSVKISADDLAAGVSATGVPVPALVNAIRREADQLGADWVHYGATSQDIIDTALALCAKNALATIDRQLSSLISCLRTESEKHAASLCMARTRGQLATPTTLGARIAAWAQPLIEVENDADRVVEQALRVQLGGASGNRVAYGDKGDALAEKLAQALALGSSLPWHTDRSPIRAMANWLCRIINALAKMGSDLQISARGEIGEMRAGIGGSSSTMPHKSNPVTAEALGSIATIATGLLTSLNAAAVHAEERDGRQWPVEWNVLPTLFSLTGAALKHAEKLTQEFEARPDVMRARIDAHPDVMAETAVFALIASVGREKATAIVKEAITSGRQLGDALHAAGFTDIDWDSILDPSACIAACEDLSNRIFSARKR